MCTVIKAQQWRAGILQEFCNLLLHIQFFRITVQCFKMLNLLFTSLKSPDRKWIMTLYTGGMTTL